MYLMKFRITNNLILLYTLKNFMDETNGFSIILRLYQIFVCFLFAFNTAISRVYFRRERGCKIRYPAAPVLYPRPRESRTGSTYIIYYRFNEDTHRIQTLL